MATAPHPSSTALLTAEEFARRPDPGYPEELVRGEVVAMTPPGFRHGRVCAQVVYLLKSVADQHDLGHVVSNDAGVVTERAPDSVRGPDVAFYRYERLPRDARIEGYPPVAPDLVIEVLSPHDRWNRVLAKVAEYLEAGVAVVGVLDPDGRGTVWTLSAPSPRSRTSMPTAAKSSARASHSRASSGLTSRTSGNRSD